RMAPKMMNSSEAATTRPLIDAAATWANEIFHRNSASTTTVMYDNGMALLAGQRNTTRKMATTMIGSKEMAARTPILIGSSFSFQNLFLKPLCKFLKCMLVGCSATLVRLCALRPLDFRLSRILHH